MISLREYQEEAIEAVIRAREEGINRQLICLPTGTGKTVTFAAIAKRLQTRTLVLAHREELIQQAKDKISLVYPEATTGLVMAANNEFRKDIVVASIQTACRDRRLKDLADQNFGLLIVDEAHHAVGDSYMKVLSSLGFMNNFGDKTLIGVTATANRADKLSLGDVFEEVVFERSICTMIQAGYLCDLKGKRVLTHTNLTSIRTVHGDFLESDLSEVVNTPERNRLIVNSYTTYAKDRKAIAFCVDVAHSHSLTQAFQAKGIASFSVYGDMPKDERKAALKDFSEGKIQVLTNCNLLTEGYDEPSVSCVLMCRPTKSAALYTQCVGRGTRLYPGKKNCLVIDFTDNLHDLTTVASLEQTVIKSPIPDHDTQQDHYSEEKRIKGPHELRIENETIEDFELFQKSQFAWIPIKDSFQLAISGNVTLLLKKGEEDLFSPLLIREDKYIPLSSQDLPLGYAQGVAEDWIRRSNQPTEWASKDAAWRNSQPSTKQLATLTKLGVSIPPEGITKGEAAALISQRINERSRWKDEPPTQGQIHFLNCIGVPFDKSITKGAARTLIAQATAARHV